MWRVVFAFCVGIGFSLVLAAQNLPAQEIATSATSAESSFVVRTTQLTLSSRPGYNRLVMKVYYPLGVSAPCPVILVSHGLGGSQNDCAYLGSAWAARGLVSIHIRHQEISEDCRGDRMRPLPAYREAYEKYWTARTVTRDLETILNWLTRTRTLGEKSPEELIGVKLDANRIGVAGYNLGALASLMLAGQLPPDGGAPIIDSRVKAVVSLGAPVYPTRTTPRQLYQPLTTPVFFVAGTADDSIVGETKAAQRRLPFDLSPHGEHYLLTLAGGDHQIYSGNRFTGRGENDAVYHRVIARGTTLFWQATLGNNANAEAILTAAAQKRGFMTIGKLEAKTTAPLYSQN